VLKNPWKDCVAGPTAIVEVAAAMAMLGALSSRGDHPVSGSNHKPLEKQDKGRMTVPGATGDVSASRRILRLVFGYRPCFADPSGFLYGLL